MAMLKVVKGNKHLLIPAGAYKKMYARQGWGIETEEGKEVIEDLSEETTLKESEKTADEWDKADEEVEMEQEKSIDEMSFKELQGKAKELKIDVRNLKTIGEYKKAIKSAIE
jgi:hypothetical protein